MEHLIPKTLVTEDDPVIKRFYEQALKDKCQSLKVVESSSEAMALLKSEQFDFLITDLKLSESSGVDIISCAVENLPDIKILVASGYVSDEQYQDELNKIDNVKGLMQKPFTLRDLTKKIESIIACGDNLPS
ncbi:MAG: response regulator [Fibrobacteria bacterium]|nr:response regulator [Fibrobacteria bacterium]